MADVKFGCGYGTASAKGVDSNCIYFNLTDRTIETQGYTFGGNGHTHSQYMLASKFMNLDVREITATASAADDSVTATGTVFGIITGWEPVGKFNSCTVSQAVTTSTSIIRLLVTVKGTSLAAGKCGARIYYLPTS